MSNASLTLPPHRYNAFSTSRAALRILRRSARERCTCGKKGYRTARKARIALETIRRDERQRQTALGQEARVERTVYRCRHSGLFHLTSI